MNQGTRTSTLRSRHLKWGNQVLIAFGYVSSHFCHFSVSAVDVPFSVWPTVFDITSVPPAHTLECSASSPLFPLPVVSPRRTGTAVHGIDVQAISVARYIDSQPTVDCAWCARGPPNTPVTLNHLYIHKSSMFHCSLWKHTDLARASEARLSLFGHTNYIGLAPRQMPQVTFPSSFNDANRTRSPSSDGVVVRVAIQKSRKASDLVRRLDCSVTFSGQTIAEYCSQ